VESDEKAIEYKKKFASVLSDIPDAHIDFSLRTILPRPSDATDRY
ncbi:unnamed protein product, partial [marine sediment metagenome]